LTFGPYSLFSEGSKCLNEIRIHLSERGLASLERIPDLLGGLDVRKAVGCRSLMAWGDRIKPADFGGDQHTAHCEEMSAHFGKHSSEKRKHTLEKYEYASEKNQHNQDTPEKNA
jgi:hypothetical protein